MTTPRTKERSAPRALAVLAAFVARLERNERRQFAALCRRHPPLAASLRALYLSWQRGRAAILSVAPRSPRGTTPAKRRAHAARRAGRKGRAARR